MKLRDFSLHELVVEIRVFAKSFSELPLVLATHQAWSSVLRSVL